MIHNEIQILGLAKEENVVIHDTEHKSAWCLSVIVSGVCNDMVSGVCHEMVSEIVSNGSKREIITVFCFIPSLETQ